MTTAGGAAQNRIEVGRSNRYLTRVQINFAIGMVITRPQHAMQTMRSRGAMDVMRNSQKHVLPNKSAVRYPPFAVLHAVLDGVVAPYDFDGGWMGCIKDVSSLGITTGFHDTVCVCC